MFSPPASLNVEDFVTRRPSFANLELISAWKVDLKTLGIRCTCFHVNLFLF
jgi:hypothetical protein